MNERIKQLAIEARLLTGWPVGEVEYQKFAELIVQECIDIIAPYTVRMSRPGEEYLHPILEIKEHFGVEE
jgi:hypothetical protein